jgi:hypothetical protein
VPLPPVVLSVDVVVVAFSALGDAVTVSKDWYCNAALALVTVAVYVCVVVPSCAVTTVVIMFDPTFSEIELLAFPLATVVPFTLTVELLSVDVGVTVMFVVALVTDTV